RRDQRGISPAEPGVGRARESPGDVGLPERLGPSGPERWALDDRRHLHHASARTLRIGIGVPPGPPAFKLPPGWRRPGPASIRDQYDRSNDVPGERDQWTDVGPIERPARRGADRPRQ